MQIKVYKTKISFVRNTPSENNFKSRWTTSSDQFNTTLNRIRHKLSLLQVQTLTSQFNNGDNSKNNVNKPS